jgi:hypothetical protein
MTAEMTVDEGRNQRGQFTPRNQAYRRGVATKAALKAEIIAELGGSLSAADAILVTRAVELLVVRPKSHTDAVRAANTANRILRTLRAKYAAEQTMPLPAPYSLESARELLERLKL